MNKPQIRELYLKKKRNADPERIAAQLGKLFSTKPIILLHSFIGNPERNEVDTKHIRQILQTEFPAMHWAVPRMVPGTRNMQHFLWDDATIFIPNRWGIEEPEPASSTLLDIQRIDAVLVPLLAFDRQGHRVGYGGGYYDRFLAECRPDALKIGVSFFDPIDTISDVDAWDVPLDFCVTPSTVYRWNSRF